jgi:hypothetical protein
MSVSINVVARASNISVVISAVFAGTSVISDSNELVRFTHHVGGKTLKWAQRENRCRSIDFPQLRQKIYEHGGSGAPRIWRKIKAKLRESVRIFILRVC